MSEPRKTIAEWRKEKHMTQMDLAVAIGIAIGTVAGIEQGRQEPSMGTARKIATVFGVGLDQIAWPEDVRHYPRKSPSPKQTPQAA